MKAKYLFVLIAVFSIILAACTQYGATAQKSNAMMGKEANEMAEIGFEMMKGKMMVVDEKSKTQAMMEKDAVLNDGTKVMTTGKAIRKDGSTFTLKEGESVWMDGSFMKAGEMKEEGMMKASVQIAMGAQGNSGETGKATIKDEGGKAEVYIELINYPGNPQPAHIHAGSCSSLGAVKYPLSAVADGKSETKLNISAEQVLSQLPLAVNVHRSAAEIKEYAACGDIKKPEAMMQQGYKGKVLAGTEKTKYLEFNRADYDKALKEKKKILLYFYANWCPTCRLEQPQTFAAFNEINDQDLIGFRVNFRDSDTDADEEALAREFGVSYQHTKIILKGGQKAGKFPDSWDKQRYLDELNKI